MKIAIASDGKMVSGHFGHCKGFAMYDVEDNKVMNTSFIENPGHRPGFLPVFLKEKGANVIISGGMGETAQDLFYEHGIDVVVGANGNCDNIVESFINGELKSTGSVCTEHMHEGHCED
ncbi:NifB/NifX family molybdenum-iron cluster-binding protein [Clostridiisalibacter paucivorans]|uniref:NifB/NifX family molybdenum-iron cluster-binding protein n=1 Tax=Clostridiisalibacter paucivorans TaxID=408753 RepID=UPI00047D9B20|nr:NifB/NifX family molybdenum-iron cluster-binding protein [Clostridiisalibacter paucivorans]